MVAVVNRKSKNKAAKTSIFFIINSCKITTDAAKYNQVPDFSYEVASTPLSGPGVHTKNVYKHQDTRAMSRVNFSQGD